MALGGDTIKVPFTFWFDISEMTSFEAKAITQEGTVIQTFTDIVPDTENAKKGYVILTKDETLAAVGSFHWQLQWSVFDAEYPNSERVESCVSGYYDTINKKI